MLPRSILKRWSIHESTQRSLVRFLFLLMVSAPTLVVAFGVLAFKIPWVHRYQRECIERELSAQLGLHVEIGGFVELSPTRKQLSQVRLIHPETEREVARVRMVDTSLTEGRWSLRFSQPELQGDQLLATWRVLHDWFLCRPKLSGRPLDIQMNDLTFHNKSHTPTLVDVHCSVHPTPDDVRATITYRHAIDRQGEAIRIELERQHRLPVPSTKISLVTNGLSVPYGMLADLFPVVRSVGDLASFEGTMNWQFNDEGIWELNQKGLLRNVQWSTLTTHHLPGFQVTGQFDVAFSELSIRNGKLHRMLGTVRGGDRGGSVSRDLLLRLSESMFLCLPDQLKRKNLTVRYHDVGFEFDLGESGFAIRGLVPIPEEGIQQKGFSAVLGTGEETLLFARNDRIPIPEVAKVLGGPSSPIASYLPFPASTSDDSRRLSSLRQP